MFCVTLALGLLVLPVVAVVHVLWLETAHLLDELDEDESKHDPAQTP